jgi:hypothetical protein
MTDASAAGPRDSGTAGEGSQEGAARAAPDLERRFVLQVLIWNAVLLALSLGLLLAWFRGQLELGGALIAAALVLAGYGAIRWPDVG